MVDREPTHEEDSDDAAKESDPVSAEVSDIGPEQRRHIALMRAVAQQITADTGDNFVLKGGTALLLVYQLLRHSTDLDFDGKRSATDLTRSIRRGMTDAGVRVTSLGIKKNTATTKRYMAHYGGTERPANLKIECSFRRAAVIDEDDITIVNGIRVYKIARLADLKLDALVNRTLGRDVFDASFLLTHYPDAITDQRLVQVAATIDDLGESTLRDSMDSDDILQAHDLDSIVLELTENVRRLLHERGL